jgi:hypothetical protein
MKCASLMACVVLALGAVPAFAEEGAVSESSLRALGLGGMQAVSDEAGMEVRGRSSAFGIVKGTSLIFGQLLTPDTKNFVVGSSVNEVDGNVESTAVGLMTIAKIHTVTLDLDLAVLFPDGSTYAGSISGIAGGAGSITSLIAP